MLSSGIALAVLSWLFFSGDALTESTSYWIDDNCGAAAVPSAPDTVRRALQEAFEMAKEADKRLEDAKDGFDMDMATVFEALFRVSVDNNVLRKETEDYRKEYAGEIVERTSFSLVKTKFHSIATEFQPANNRDSANVRFTCGNAGWNHDEDDEGEEFWINNDHQVRDYQDAKPCDPYEENEETIIPQAETSNNAVPLNDGDIPQRRNLITICSANLLNRGGDRPDLLQTLEQEMSQDNHGINLARLRRGVESLETLLSFTILHELLHTEHYLLDDVPVDDVPADDVELAYSWESVMSINDQKAVNNVNNHVYFALIARLWNFPPMLDDQGQHMGGWTLQRKEEEVAADGMGWREAWRAGKLRAYTRMENGLPVPFDFGYMSGDMDLPLDDLAGRLSAMDLKDTGVIQVVPKIPG